MKKVYEAQNSIEGHMLVHMLEQQGVEARLDGEYLQGGVGELPAAGLVTVRVEEADYEKAKDIIQEWEQAQPRSTEAETGKSRYGTSFFSGAATGAFFAWLILSDSNPLAGMDQNRDGFLEEKYSFLGQKVTQRKSDRNGDQVYDAIVDWNKNGQVSQVQLDNNFDGIFDLQIRYTKGYPRTKTYLDRNSEPVKVEYFDRGVLKKSEIFQSGTRKVVKRHFYSKGKLISSEYDSNADGEMDWQDNFDYYENSVNSPR